MLGIKNKRFSFLSDKIGIDLGTANTILCCGGEVVLNEPSVVAVYQDSRKVFAVGEEAKSMLGRTPPGIEVFRPLRDGVIADFDISELMLKSFIGKVRSRRSFMSRTLNLFHPEIAVCVPGGATAVERRAIHDAALSTGARRVLLIEEAMAAAIGSGLPVMAPVGSMVVDIGGGTTEVAVVSLGGVVLSTSVRYGGNKLDEAIIYFFRRAKNLSIGENTAEKLKCALGTAYIRKGDENESLKVKGRDITLGIPKEIEVTKVEIAESLEEPIMMMLGAVQATLEKTPPELAADIAEHGIVLTGGGALLDGLSERINLITGLKVRVAEDPLLCVARGTGQALDLSGQIRSYATL